jgi:hypothetical protein
VNPIAWTAMTAEIPYRTMIELLADHFPPDASHRS